jgi:hypothetical protein
MTVAPRQRPGGRVAAPAAWLAAALATALCPGLAAPALAWTATARERLVDDAIALSPASLREILGRRRADLLSGMLAPGSAEDQPEHWQHPTGEYGTAAARALAESRELIAAVNGHRPMTEIARRFGRLAHWVADVNDPLHAGDRDPALARYYADYERYVEQQMPRFPLVFEGYRSPILSSGGPQPYLLAVAERSRQYAAVVRRAYLADGRRVSPEAFDVRSLAFGIGSLATSDAVNDIARVWLWTWEACHGDTSGTPYPLPPAPSAAAPAGPSEAAAP